MVYDINGISLSNVYDINGNTLNQAYDVDGNSLLGGTALTVMSYNVQWFTGINANQTLQEDIFDSYNADIVGLQEYRRSGQDASEMGVSLLEERYGTIYEGTQSNRTAMVSEYALSNVSTVLYTVGGVYGYQKAYFTVGSKTICWANTHLNYSDRANKTTQAMEVFNAIKNEQYFVLTGDLNTDCTSTTDADYVNIIKMFIDAGCHCANCTPQRGFVNTWYEGNTISSNAMATDNIITSANISIDNVVVDTSKFDLGSSQTIDHLPLIAYLTIN